MIGLKHGSRGSPLSRQAADSCPDIDDENLVARVISLFDLESRRKKLGEYLDLLKDFLPEGLSRAVAAGDDAAGDDAAGEEFARRLLYVGAVHWENVEASEPPIPAKYLPTDYAFKEIQAFYGRRLEEGRAAMLGYFRRVFVG